MAQRRTLGYLAFLLAAGMIPFKAADAGPDDETKGILEAFGIQGGLPEKWSLVARDAFNGKLLWKRPLEDWGWREWE